MECRDQLNPSWTANVRTTTWIWEVLHKCLWLSVDRKQMNNTITNLFSNHMTIDFNVFVTLMKHRIGS